MTPGSVRASMSTRVGPRRMRDGVVSTFVATNWPASARSGRTRGARPVVSERPPPEKNRRRGPRAPERVLPQVEVERRRQRRDLARRELDRADGQRADGQLDEVVDVGDDGDALREEHLEGHVVGEGDGDGDGDVDGEPRGLRGDGQVRHLGRGDGELVGLGLGVLEREEPGQDKSDSTSLSVPRARVPSKPSTLRDRSER